jgi:apolipoprotein N-acyltransferase
LRWCPALPLVAAAAILAAGELLREVRWTQEEGEPLSVALLQGNVAQEMKWRPERFADSLHSYYRLALENPARLTVLPETALPAFLDQIPATISTPCSNSRCASKANCCSASRSPKAGNTSMRR